MIRNAHLYSQNRGRAYPLADTVSAVDDAGRPLPFDLLTDVRLSYPREYGAYPYVAAASVGPEAVSVIWAVADDPDTPGQALAAVTLSRPVVEGRPYPLRPLRAGVGGWVVFGSAIDGPPFSCRPSRFRQAGLSRRAFRLADTPPLRGVRVFGQDGLLTGVVRLEAEPPLAISVEDRELPGVGWRRVIVFRLTGNIPGDPSGASEVFARFVGPCGGRPESGTCGEPPPLESINGVAPDCSGTLTLEVRGLVTARPGDAHTIVFESGVSLPSLCPPPYLPDAQGRLPGEYVPYQYPPPPPPPPPSDSSLPDESDSILGELPAAECFREQIHPTWQVLAGSWERSQQPDSPDQADRCPLPLRTSSRQQGLLAYYPLDGNFADHSGSDLHLSVVPATPVFVTHLRADGRPVPSVFRANVRPHPILGGRDLTTSDLTLASWVHCAAPSGNDHAVLWWSLTGSPSFDLIVLPTAAPYVGLRRGGAVTFHSIPLPQPSGWNLIAVVFESGQLKVWINGQWYYQTDFATTGCGTVTTGQVVLHDNDWMPKHLHVSESAIWDRALAAAELLSWYGAGEPTNLLGL